MNAEIRRLLAKSVIIECEREQVGFISTVFTRQEKDVYFIVILDLKHINHYGGYNHFKMKLLKDLLKIIKKKK